MPKIFLLRHGETVWNNEQRIQGQLDSPLTPKGRMQAAQNGERLRDLLKETHFKVVSSPLGRALATAEIVASRIGVTPAEIELEDRLREISFGNWEGKTWTKVKETDEQAYNRRVRDRWTVRAPGGENYQDVAERLQSWLTGLNDETIVVISHGCAGRILRTIHADLDKDETSNLSESHESIFLLTEDRLTEH